MIKQIKEYFYNKNYTKAVEIIKKGLQEDSENSELWYHLFLAENGDYFTTDFENGYTNELSFNKALEIASRRKRAGYLSEYNFYKTISKCNGLNILFRYAQYGNIDEFGKRYNSIINNMKIDIPKEDLYNFYDNLDYIVNTMQGGIQMDLSRLLVNYLYIQMQNKDILEILTDLIENSKKANTPLINIFSEITENVYDITYYLNLAYDAYKDRKVTQQDEKKVTNDIPSKYNSVINYIGDFEFTKEFLKLYNGQDSVVVLPKMKKISVGAISRGHHHTNIREVVMHDTVTFLGDCMFQNCSNLRYVRLSNYIKSIPNYTFDNCKSLWNVVIPHSVTSIGEAAFRNCTSLKKLDYLGIVKSFGYRSFEGCTGFKEFEFPKQLAVVGNEAFKDCTKLESIIMYPGIETVVSNAFMGCTNLKNIYFIGNLAQWCNIEFKDNANPLNIAENLYILDNFGDVEYNGRRFKKIEHILSKDNIYKISDNSFNGSVLETVEIPDTLNNILGSYAFSKCKNLKSVMVHDNCTSIGRETFADCISLKDVHLGNAVEYIYPSVFKNCASLENINFPENIKYIGSYAFNNCTSLKTIKLNDNCTSIEEHSFDGCESLTSFTAGSKFQDICKYAFNECESLVKVELHSIKKIYDYAFNNCSALKDIIIPKGLTRLESHVFANCKSLETITLPDTLTYVDSTTFHNCLGLKKIIFKGKKNKWNKVVFSDKKLFGSK